MEIDCFPKVSENGDWICYAITPQRGDALLEFYNAGTKQTTRIERGGSPAWFNNDTWATFKIAVPFAKVRQAKIDKVKADKMPKDTFAVMNLAEMKVVKPAGRQRTENVGEGGALCPYL
ncbi:MAG: hypothetical protein ACLR8Y_19590 [Alistipes indistinctus]